VQKYMRELDVPFARLAPSRYAEGLRRTVRNHEPQRLVDLLLCGALIEARSCERFIGLAPRLAPPLADFYGGLAHSEARHRALYLRLVEPRASGVDWSQRLRELAAVEADLVTSPDPQFRFHSGSPL
jgi:tRNA 2-(methylsulfanyl)-N6-isopentenyladenosine37 hydroxylase